MAEEFDPEAYLDSKLDPNAVPAASVTVSQVGGGGAGFR